MTNDIQAKTRESEEAAISFAEATIRIMNELVQIMAEEGDLLGSDKSAEHSVLLDRKKRLTLDYRANIKTLAETPDMLKLVPEKLRAGLKTSGQKLADISERNAKTLRGAVLATQRLIQNIISYVRKEVLPKASYGNPADVQGALGSYSPTCKPVMVNRTA